METKTKQTFELSEEDLHNAIRDWVNWKYGKTGDIKIDVSVKTITTGFGMMERDAHEVVVKAERDA